jgi:hypothetical protein
MKEKLMLILGCSHAAGSEIDGTEDSVYNRQNTFGNLLAAKSGRRPVNIASNAANNQTISRTLLEWFEECYNPDTMDLFVLVAWTESSRIDMPMDRITWHETWNPASDYISKSARDYIRINLGYKGSDEGEKVVISRCHDFIANHLNYIEILSANLILQTQYFLKMHNVEYAMCNTMHMFDRDKTLDFYIRQIDQTKYYKLTDNDQSFFWKYKNAGFVNTKAKYWHHGEEPHKLFSEELYQFISNYASQ